MKHVLEMTEADLSAEVAVMGQPAYRARQIAQWVWRRHVGRFADMTNLPAPLREALAKRLTILSGRVAARSDAPDGVVKLLLEWPDGERVETVMIPTDRRRTACLSSQVGCPIGCAFCASGLGGLCRDMSAGEIVEQMLHLRAAADAPITHVVLMGVGEPLANYDAALAAVRAMIDPARGGLSARHITLSTVGVPEAIGRLASEGIPLTLAISLHAPNDALRRRLIPAAKGVTIAELIAAARAYFDRTGREVTLEYVLLAGVNDSPACAAELASMARQLRCNVNLIRYNPVAGLPFRRPAEAAVRAFADALRAGRVNVQIRASRGAGAQAACGQLRRVAAGPPPAEAPAKPLSERPGGL